MLVTDNFYQETVVDELYSIFQNIRVKLHSQ